MRLVPPAGIFLATWAALLAVSNESAAAPSGWMAIQTTSSPGMDGDQRFPVSYGHHRMRIDLPAQRLIIDFRSGAFIYVDTRKKEYSAISLEEMVALRKKKVEALKAQLKNLPAEMREQMSAQLETAQKAAQVSIKATPSQETKTINGFECSMFTWSGNDTKGRACIATKVPFDLAAFRKDSLLLSKKMVNLGAGNAATSMAVLQLGEHGFPISIEQNLRMGANEVTVNSAFEEIKASKKSKSYFLPPADYKKRDFEKMMTEQVSGPPRMPPVKKP